MFRIQTYKKFLVTFLAFSCVSAYAGDADQEQRIYERLKKRIHERGSRSTSIVLGSPNSDKSMLISLLMHISEYATLETEGDVLIDSEDETQVFYQQDVSKNFISIVKPVTTESELFPKVYQSHSKVKKPSFYSTFIDAPEIGEVGRLAFLINLVKELPRNPGFFNGFLLVIEGDTLVGDDFGDQDLKYYVNIKKILEELDPDFNRVFLVVTKANDKFLSMIQEENVRQVVSEKFKIATSGMHIPSERIFFFENQYNCLGEFSIDQIYNCNIADSHNPLLEDAVAHRFKNYRLNVFESFNLLKALSQKTPISRFDLLEKISLSIPKELSSGQLGNKVNVGPNSLSALGSLTLPEGRWQITAGSTYNGLHGNAYYMHSISTKANSIEGTTLGVDYLISAMARDQGIASAPPMTKVVDLTQATTFYLNAQTQLYDAGMGGILGIISAVRLSPLNY